MLATTASDVASAVNDIGLCSVEWKLDGVRIQLHRQGDTVRIWTRNLNDVSDRLGEVAEAMLAVDQQQLALDGELIGVTDATSVALFQDTMSRVGTGRGSDTTVDRSSDNRAAPAFRLQPMFFDIFHLNGRDLISEPLHRRLVELAAAVPDHQVPSRLTDDPAVGQQVFDEAVAAGHEGVMVKAANTPYTAGRRGKAWRKVKPVHKLDLIVLAVEPGSGRRRGWLSNIHLGARANDGSGFVMVGKTFKGMTDAMLAWQTQRFEELATSHKRHVVEIRPEQVVEVAVDGVQRSRRYKGGVALRFARVVRYRDDKSAKEADTIEVVRKLLR